VRSWFGALSVFGVDSSFVVGASLGAISRFGARSSFGAHSIFGARSDFGAGSLFGAACEFEARGPAKPGYPFVSFGGFGSENRTTYAFNLESGIVVRCGCFCGTLNEFRTRVRETYPDSDHGRAYLAIADLIDMQFASTGREEIAA